MTVRQLDHRHYFVHTGLIWFIKLVLGTGEWRRPQVRRHTCEGTGPHWERQAVLKVSSEAALGGSVLPARQAVEDPHLVYHKCRLCFALT